MDPEPALEARLDVLQRRWATITEIPAQPRSVMNVVEYGLGNQRRAEVYVIQLLRYFLDATEPHGMRTDFLRAFLEGLPAECDFHEDLYEVSDVTVDEQVSITQIDDTTGETGSPGWLDLCIRVPDEWFLVVELKFSAPETGTTFYCEADAVEGRRKSEYESDEYYQYLHQVDEHPAMGACFANWTWTAFIEDVLEPFLVRHGPRYPQRTVTPLREFVYEFTEITGMSDHEQSEQEKVDLYVENYDVISDVSDAFERRWDAVANEWQQRLVDRVDDPEIPNDWVFWEYDADWAFIYKSGWWRRVDSFEPIAEPVDPNRLRTASSTVSDNTETSHSGSTP